MGKQEYLLIANELRKILMWKNDAKLPSEEEHRNIDKLYDYLRGCDGFDFNYGIEGCIYNLADLYIDSKTHSFKQMAVSYSYEDAERDINYIISMIEQDKVEELESDERLRQKNHKIYSR